MGRGLFGGRDNRLCFLWYLIGLGCVVSGLVCLTSSGFSSGLLFSVGVFLASGFHCVCVYVCVCVRARARSLAHLVYLQERKNFLTNEKECREGKLASLLQYVFVISENIYNKSAYQDQI